MWFPRGGLLVLDDLMDEGGNDKCVLDLFTKHWHHQNITVMYLRQDMFPRDRSTVRLPVVGSASQEHRRPSHLESPTKGRGMRALPLMEQDDAQ